MRYFGLSGAILAAIVIAFSHPADAKPGSCSFPKWENTSVDELVAAIEADPSCALPWAALKKSSSNSKDIDRLREAYRTAIARHSDKAGIAKELALQVDAAAGKPEAMLAFYDGNVAAHPEDKSLPNASCWVRGMTGYDIEHAMSFCDKAVATGRAPYSLINRGIVNLLLNRNEAALADFDEALANRTFRDHPFFATALFGRGFARLRLNNSEGAQDLRKGFRLNPRIKANFEAAGIR